MRTRYGRVDAFNEPGIEPEAPPTRLAPLLAFGVAQLTLLGLFVAMLGAAIGQAMGLGGSGQGGSAAGALATFGLFLGVFLAAPAYIAYTSGHQHPVIRLGGGLLVYILTGVVCSSVLFNIREELWLATPMIATGAMLAVLLPEARAYWKLARLAVPAASGLLAIGPTAVIGDTRDVSIESWAVVISAGFGVGLAGLWFIERFRE